MRIWPGLLIALLLVPAAPAQTRLSQADLLRRVIDLDRLATPPAGERTGMFSSYDRASKLDEHGKQVNWDANGDAGQFIRDEPDDWHVMAEMRGPGFLTRIWSANPHGQIRFILDGETVIDAPFADLFNGKLAPFAEPFCYMNPNNGGQNCYFPIGYAQSCKVVLKDGLPYYQINYVTTARETTVERFTPELDDDAKLVLTDVAAALKDGYSDRQLFGGRRASPQGEQKDLKPNETLSWPIEGAGTIRALYVALTDRSNPRELYALHDCVLRVYVDGKVDPNVEAPLVDFFGSGFDLRPYNSLVLGTDKELDVPLPGRRPLEDRYMYCYFPMPFANGAKVELENRSGLKIGFLLHLRIDPAPPAAEALRFFARFRKEDPCKQLDYPILEATGRGRIVGCLLNVDCPRAAWWGEGDDKVWIDGEKFPSYFGTGSEDYLGDAWGLRPHIRPLQGVTLTGPFGKNSAYRWHIADCIDFEKSVKFTIENWQHNRQWDTYYGTIAYWYADAGSKNFFKPLKPEDLALPGLRIPGAVEIEGHIAGSGWGNVVKQKYAGGVEYSHEEAASISSTEPFQVTLPSKTARVVRLKLRTHPRRAFESVEVRDAAGRTIGTVKYDRNAHGMYDVGLVRLDAGDNVLTVQCAKEAVLDCWVLENVPKNAAGPEGEDLKVVADGGAAVSTEFALLNWSGGGQLAATFRSPGQALVLALPEQAAEQYFAVTLVVTRGPDGGRFQALLNDQPLGEPFDLFAAEPAIDRVAPGAGLLRKGANTLGFKALDRGGKPGGLKLGLDCIDLYTLRSPFALEAEQLKVVGESKSAYTVQPLGAGYSGGSQVWCRPTEPGAWIEFEVPVKAAGKYKVSIVYTTSFDYGIVQTYVNGRKAGEPFDTFGNLEPGPVRELGVFDLALPGFKLKAELVGHNERSPGYYFGVDCVIVEPAK